ncbi:hypothetical protein BKA61DRAFT_678806 [Leptodontidium sp. MPI-SDFR-AT-0119]|nr:hypothetical protein BKA61DRAFT_678806 [Leptodontidium sp. MPI-SDFR-AT-0119]
MGPIKVEQLFPEGGCDTHHHIFEPHNFPYSPNRHLTPPKATVEQFQAFKESLGITHSVLTHGLSCGHDCSCLTAFIDKLGPSTTRGCAVINEETTDVEIEALHDSGVRGIRLDLYGYKSMEDLQKQIRILRLYADRVRPKGWFLEFLQINQGNWEGLGQVILTLGLQVVTDHHALMKAESMLPTGANVLSQPGLADIVALLKTGNFWIKTSAPYRSSTIAPYYEDMKPLVLTLVNANPQRVLWGSNYRSDPVTWTS